ncbi:MAG: HAD hydrolase-like protein, partial [FCB group bacterium]|nr:HAD hydrolase-like protein [FCB group bacterium]
MIKYLIFDLDGTLIDSSEGVVEAVNYSLRQVDEKERPSDEIKAFIGYPLKTMYTHFTQVPFEKLYPYFQER